MKMFVKTKGDAGVAHVMGMHTRTEAVLSPALPNVVIADLDGEEAATLRESSEFEVFDDIQFQPATIAQFQGNWWDRQIGRAFGAVPPPWVSKTQADVMGHNRADQAWFETSGDGVTIAIVDTGVDGSRADWEPARRSALSYSPSFSTPWEDAVGHGTMCAAIACASTKDGGDYNGVAPSATLLSARSTLQATDLYLIFQHLLREYRRGSFPGGLVVSNSYGLYVCSPPSFPAGHPYVDLVRLCVQAGMTFVFAAGNNHGAGLCNFPAADCGPNTIWTVNSIDEVITVGTVNWDGTNRAPGEHANSSRGPGQWSTRADKPDVVAPTYGRVAWGGSYEVMEWWGTSGACPQVAGLAAILLEKRPSLTPNEIRTVVRTTASNPDGHPTSCIGAGIIDCLSAVRSIVV